MSSVPDGAYYIGQGQNTGDNIERLCVAVKDVGGRTVCYKPADGSIYQAGSDCDGKTQYEDWIQVNWAGDKLFKGGDKVVYNDYLYTGSYETTATPGGTGFDANPVQCVPA